MARLTHRSALAAFTLYDLLLPGARVSTLADEPAQPTRYQSQIKPIRSEYGYGCHGEGEKAGGLGLDTFASDDELLKDRTTWYKVLKKVRSRLMPPHGEPAPSDRQREQI